jgi:predicted secreted protein
MSFGLKNTDATYQRAIQACFKRQLNKNAKAYVDDVVVKTRNSDTLIIDLEETFTSLREYRWKLNRTSASSVYVRENYSASSSAIMALKPTPKRSLPLPR